MKKSVFVIAVISIIGLAILSISSCDDINPVDQMYFDEDGKLLTINKDSAFKMQPPQKIKYYVEVSGSMNGFFRANRPTDFKADVWQIMSYFSELQSEITILKNDGNTGEKESLNSFKMKMNTGAFVSGASTQVPSMLKSIMNDFDTQKGEIAILISDMKYDPVGAEAPDVLMTQYSSDISDIIGKGNRDVCLIGAISSYLDKKGVEITNKSPYYFLIIGKDENVAYFRNSISTLLFNNGRLIDNIESGFDYGSINFTFGMPDNCWQMDNVNPTFVGYDPSDSDTCTINLKISLENYRWAIADSLFFTNGFKVKSLYGSGVKLGNVKYEIENITGKQLIRKATAIVDLKVFGMPMDADVLEWTLELPDLDVSKFSPYMGAMSPNDVDKTFSLENFLKGIFYGGVVNKTLKPNYILISKNS
ncbi:MAG: hypothetical protein E7107_06865 [Prevotella sp.]|jgi:hypothetical protein|nr:hypothetical protein [Prevotella sp.]